MTVIFTHTVLFFQNSTQRRMENEKVSGEKLEFSDQRSAFVSIGLIGITVVKFLKINYFLLNVLMLGAFDPNSACDSKETTTIGKTHLTLINLRIKQAYFDHLQLLQRFSVFCQQVALHQLFASSL